MQTSPPDYFPTRYWHKLEDGRVCCDVCPRKCTLREGKRGACFVRMHRQGEIVLTSYGRSSGFCIDPIEKKPLNHFYPGSSVLSFGTAGCNLSCQFCQNWDISKSREFDTLCDTAMPDELAQTALKYGCKSLAFTYNDPVVFMEYAIDAAIAARDLGLKSVAVSAGYICEEPREEFYRHMDAANIDLKGFTEHFYHKICHGHLQPVLDTLLYLKKKPTYGSKSLRYSFLVKTTVMLNLMPCASGFLRTWGKRTTSFQRLPSGFQNVRQRQNPAEHLIASPGYRPFARITLCLLWQCSRSGLRCHLLPFLR